MDKLNRFENKFPFAISRKATDSNEFYNGLCQGANLAYEMLKVGMFEDGAFPLTYFSHETNRSVTYKKYFDSCEEDDTEDECIDEVYEEGFDDGFRHGYQSAQEEVKADIFVDTDKICKIDQLQHEILELGNKLHPSDIDKLNAILKRVVDLKYEVAKDAVDEYLGYK